MQSILDRLYLTIDVEVRKGCKFIGLERSCVSSGGFEVTDASAGQLFAGAWAKPIMVIPPQSRSVYADHFVASFHSCAGLNEAALLLV